MALAYGVFAAGIVQLLFQLPFLAKLHLVPRPKWNIRHDGVRRAGKLMLPAIFGSSVAQINVLLGGVIASFLGVGKISLLYYSDRLMEFPLGLFGIALATVTLPTLSRHHASESTGAFSATVDWSMKLVLLIALPAAIGLIVLAEPLVATIFYGGEFTAVDVELTAWSLQAFALGLLGFSYVKILAPAYFAREDTKTPVRIGVIALVVNFVLSVILAYALTRAGSNAAHVGLALATSVAALVNAGLLYRGLRRDKIVGGTSGWPALLVQVMVANAAMVGCLSFLHQPLDWWIQLGLASRIGWLGIAVVTGVIAYFLVLLLVGVRPSAFRLRRP